MSWLPWLNEDLAIDAVQDKIKSVLQKKSVNTEYTGIRKRLLEQQSSRADQEISRLRKLQGGQDRLLIEKRIADLRAVKNQLRNEVTFVERQDAAARKEAVDFNKMEPLQQVRKVQSFIHRSDRPQSVAIAGLLERERKQRMKLSRGQFDRVKAKAAARHRLELARMAEKDGKFRRGVSRRAARPIDAQRVRRELEICNDRHVRREVLAAKMMLGHSRIGYRKRKDRSEFLHFVRCY